MKNKFMALYPEKIGTFALRVLSPCLPAGRSVSTIFALEQRREHPSWFLRKVYKTQLSLTIVL
ncbi:MAG: hypothetical protein HY063_13730 [Bacteroidetes bacterium]|nr:hypothetical protein [Bacteroidota bacterium]